VTKTILWLVPLFGLLMWQIVCHLLSLIGGYFRLIRSFPPSPDSISAEQRFASGRIGLVRFNNALHFKIGQSGLHLGPNILFRPWTAMDLPCIPWNEISILKATHYWGGMYTGTRLTIRSVNLEFEILNPPALALVDHIESLGTGSGQSQVGAPLPMRPF
jgi:hypothetical protein